MGADSRGGRRRDALRLGALLGGSGLVLITGCASMPDSGDVQVVKASPRADAQVRVHPVAPRKGAEAQDIIDGFLEAMTSDDADFATARAYLSPEKSRTWQPQKSTTVLAVAPTTSFQPQANASGQLGKGYLMSGTQIAKIDDQQAYQAVAPEDYRFPIHVSRQGGADGEWRIDSLPDGLVLGQSDFQRNYRPVNKYYFASGRNTVVADPVFIQQRMDPVTKMDPVTQSVKALLDGPTNWLKPVVESRFPSGTALAKGVTSLTVDDRDVLKVPLNEKAANAGHAQCRKMAAQIMFTLKDLSAVRVAQIELQRPDGSQLCMLADGQEKEYASDQSAAGAKQYFVNEKNQLAVLNANDKETAVPEPVPGPMGTGQLPVGGIAVARDERTAAAVSTDSAKLYVEPVTMSGDIVQPVYISRGKLQHDRLTAPSWDGRGDLWFADRDLAGPALLRRPAGQELPQKVTIAPGLDGARIHSVKVAADGTRIALLLAKGGKTTLYIGRVERTGTQSDPVVSVDGLLPAAPQMVDVKAVSWAGPSRLVVVGRESGGVEQVRYIQTDGSTSASSVLPGLNQVVSIAASNNEGQPLVAHSTTDGIVRLPTGATWQMVVGVGKGTSPVYPG
ncbi:LpqB family beta-propeller domain-containing protein [Streptomyces qinzhouensis]|uniref:LpqB family beta-propeller domain-containing protein n=1 Tax=Streptomyces qinzhouensis TaxID=2599401 RepID=UPI003CCC64B1